MGHETENFWGHLIQELRDERGLSQRKLADASHVNRSTLRRIEDGTARGDIAVIERLLGEMGYELEAMHNVSVKAQHLQEEKAANDPTERSKAAMRRLLQLTANSPLPTIAI